MRRHLALLQLILALAAWTAQLCLPVAHAATMASSASGAWCGEASPVLRAQLARLPADIRRILEPAVPASPASLDCAAMCAATAGPGLPPPAFVPTLVPLGKVMLSLSSFDAPAPRPHGPPLPARGPPHLT